MNNSRLRHLGITLTLQNCDTKKGIALRTRIENTGGRPQTLIVCPDMLLCCVEGLHILVKNHDGLGMGCLDVCNAQEPSHHEVFLPERASFAFDMTIPVERLPASFRKRGEDISLSVCYEFGEDSVVCSNVVKAKWK